MKLLAGSLLLFATLAVAPAVHATPAYVVTEAEISDRAGYQSYIDRVNPLSKAAGVSYLALGGKTIPVGGEAPKRIVIYVFDSLDKAEAFFASPAYQELVPIRDKAAKWRGYIVEGVAP